MESMNSNMGWGSAPQTEQSEADMYADLMREDGSIPQVPEREAPEEQETKSNNVAANSITSPRRQTTSSNGVQLSMGDIIKVVLASAVVLFISVTAALFVSDHVKTFLGKTGKGPQNYPLAQDMLEPSEEELDEARQQLKDILGE